MQMLISITTIVLSSTFFCAAVIAKQPSDDLITEEIKSLLNKESDIPINKLQVSTNDGVVLLNGTVDTRLQADKIIQVANSINNVKDVDTYNLKVTKSNQYLTDAFVTSAVKGKLVSLARSNKISNNYDFHIETTNGHVHIFGKISNNHDISVIEREIVRIKGVKKVHCNINIM